MTEVQIAQEITSLEALFPYEEPARDDAKAHVINPVMNHHLWQPGMTAQDIVDTARATGMFVISLCRTLFIPKHDPGPLDACEKCMEIAARIVSEDG